MNSTRRYSVRKIISKTTCFVLSLDTKNGSRHWVFANAQWLEKRQTAVGIEFGESEICCARRLISTVPTADFYASGIYTLFYQVENKLRFTLPKAPFLRGSYVLLCPSWGRRSTRKMWLLIPTQGKDKYWTD